MTEYQKILEKLRDANVIEESDVSALITSFDTAVAAAAVASIQKQEEDKLQEEQTKNELVLEIKNGYNRLLTEEMKKMRESFEMENEAIIEEAVNAKVEVRMAEVEKSTAQYKEEMLDKVVSVMTEYIEENILPNVHENIIEEAYSVLIAEADEKDEAINELKKAVVRISSIIEEGKTEDDDEEEEDTQAEEEKKKSDSDVEVEAEMKDEDETEDEEEDKEDEEDKPTKKVEESISLESIKKSVKAKIVEEQVNEDLRLRAKERARLKIIEEQKHTKIRAKLIQEQRKAQRKAMMIEEELKLVQEQRMITDLIEEETDGLSRSQANTVRKILDGRPLQYVQENIESVVEDIIEESIGYSRQRARAYSNMVVDRSNYADLNETYIKDADAGNQHIAQAKQYL